MDYGCSNHCYLQRFNATCREKHVCTDDCHLRTRSSPHLFFLLFLFFKICFAVTPHILQQVLLMQDCGPQGFDRSPGEIKRREVELGSHRWVDCIALLLSASSTASFWTLIMRLCSALLLKQQSAKYTRCFPLAGSPPP